MDKDFNEIPLQNAVLRHTPSGKLQLLIDPQQQKQVEKFGDISGSECTVSFGTRGAGWDQPADRQSAR